MTSPKIIQEIGSKVSYTEAQNLTNEQKTQTRQNLGIVSYESQTLTDSQKAQVRTNIGAIDNSNVVSITGAQTISGTKTFSTSPVVPTPNADDDSQKAVNTAWVTDILESDITALEGIASGQDPTSEPLLQPSNIVTINGAQTVTGAKEFTVSPTVPTATAGDNSQKVANTAFVQGEIASKANASEVVKLTGNQAIAGTKTFSDSPEVPTPASGDNSQKTASTGFVQNTVDSQAVRFDSAQTLTDAQKKQARSNIGSAENNVTPIGSYIYFAGSSVPDHYLLCNGAAVSRSVYADLFNVIGTTYGAGDGSTTFNLPNLIDKFLEGSGTSGTVKSAGLPNVTSKSSSYEQVCAWTGGGLGAGAITLTPTDYAPSGGSIGRFHAIDFDASRSSAIYGNSATVQPPALTALPCIRYE